MTLQGADVRDITSLIEAAIMAAEQGEGASAPTALAQIVADRDYHSNQMLVDLHAVGVRSYIAEPDRCRRCWPTAPEAQAPVYGNRRRVGGVRGRQLMRRRGQYVERSFAHVYDTGRMRPTHLRVHENILTRLLVHAGAFDLGLLMRKAFGRGTPRGLQGRRFDAAAPEISLATLLQGLWTLGQRFWRLRQTLPPLLPTYWAVVHAC